MSIAKKYELTNDTINVNRRTLYRIRALRDFGDVKAGDFGGFIETEENLSHEGDCWVWDGACVYENAYVHGHARVYGYAEIGGKARVYGKALIFDNALVFENAHVFGDAEISDNARVYGDAEIGGNAHITGENKICSGKHFGNNTKIDTNTYTERDVKAACKDDAHKSRVDLIPPSALFAIGHVLAVGARKYGANNWRNGMDWSRLHGAALRHLLAWFNGEDKDPESGLSHLAHAACCLLFLMDYDVQQIGCDDRPQIKTVMS
ncbi:dATP/dGTP diphosphohydrolase domain-containing protein [Bartonella schoenbuchensis]|uniref:Phage related protein n=1 Tax=Bartonella schoenbuchensis m07a TaxID=1094496 RepID=N6VDQ0_9HYPH|nr:phage related protein [Bartonella schoenbuchensis m07a]